MSQLDSTKYSLIESGEVTTLDVKVKGTPPTKGNVTIINGRVTEANLCINNYSVHYDGTTATIEGNACDGTSKPTEYTVYAIGTAVYYNPVEGKKCTDYVEANSATGTKTGCMKFYTFNDEGKNTSTVNMILDHNTTALVAWNSSRSNASGPSLVEGQIMDKLKKDTEGWNGVTTRTDKYEFKSETINYTIDYNGYKARLITADEIAKITKAKDALNWDSSKPYADSPIKGTSISYYYLDGAVGTDTTWHTPVFKTQGASKYAWLFDNTYGCTDYGCNKADSSNYGYWTSNSVVGISHIAWRVDRRGHLSVSDVGNVDDYGVRPVITIEKSKIS